MGPECCRLAARRYPDPRRHPGRHARADESIVNVGSVSFQLSAGLIWQKALRPATALPFSTRERSTPLSSESPPGVACNTPRSKCEPLIRRPSFRIRISLSMKMSMEAPVPCRSPAQNPSCPRWAHLLQMLDQSMAPVVREAHVHEIRSGVVAGQHLDSKQRLTVRAIAASLRPPLN